MLIGVEWLKTDNSRTKMGVLGVFFDRLMVVRLSTRVLAGLVIGSQWVLEYN
jgi:hypothetical protein